MTRWFPLAPADDAFLRSAPLRFVHSADIAAAPDRVWRALTADDALVSWAAGITGSQWSSPRPFGVGTTRTVTVGRGAAALRERFFRWDEGLRMTFAAEASTRPGLRRFAEDVALTPTPTGTRLTWTFAVDAEPWLAPLLAVARPLLDRVTAGWTRGVERRVTGAYAGPDPDRDPTEGATR